MPKEAKPNSETTEDLASKGALFDVETPDGTIKIVLPALEPETDPSETER